MDCIAIQKFLDERAIELPEFAAAWAQRLQLSSYWELAGLASIVLFVGGNLKALPLAHSLRLLPSLRRLLTPRLFRRTKKPSSNDDAAAAALVVAAAHPSLFRHNTTASRAILLDLDINIHKSNSTFFADADISRASLLTSLLSPALAARGALFVLAGTQCKFLREIRPFQSYVVASQILTWTDKAFYTVTYFVSARRGDAGAVCGRRGGPAAVLGDDGLRRKLFAVLVSKYVFKEGRMTVAPVDVFGAAGLLRFSGAADGVGSGDGKGGEKRDQTEMLGAEEIKRIVEEGMEFVRDCML